MSNDVTVGSVAEIWRYPVKSMGGDRLPEATIDAAGIPGDRRLALRDLGSGKILSAKQPRVANALLDVDTDVDPATGAVTITVGGRTIDTTDREAAEAALSEHLDRPVRLESSVADDDVYESYWPEVPDVLLSDVSIDLPVAMSTAKESFVDLAALQMVTTASLAALAALAPDSEIVTRRFRPSLVIDTDTDGTGVTGFVENEWRGRSARLGDAAITFTDPSPRCVMTTVAQGDLPRDLEVLRTLARHNRIETAGLGNFACLGIYAEVVRPGRVAVGDPLVLD
jgi:uncharacterized protein YcbX